FKEELIDNEFWLRKLSSAYQLRKVLGKVDNEKTTCFRLVHAEGDGLPGLIIDIYNRTAVVQAHSLGMFNAMEEISAALKTVFSDQLEAVYTKSENTLHQKGELEIKDGYILGKEDCPQIVKEHDLQFDIDWISGQKTGFFIDQRENRKLLQNYVKN